MRKFILFIVSFIVLFGAFQILSGLFLTAVYTPDVSGAWKQSTDLPQTIVFGDTGNFIPTWLLAAAAASIAFFVPKLFAKRK
jgi:hypothetical protein